MEDCMGPVPTQELHQEESTSSKEQVEHLRENVLASVHEDLLHQINSTATSTCDSKQDQPRLVHQCVHCGATFQREVDLELHERSLHPEAKVVLMDERSEVKVSKSKTRRRKGSLKCKVCEVPFTFPSDLRRHALRVHCEVRLFKCEICGEKFYYKSELNAHTQVHTREKPFQCVICMKGFDKRHDLQKHIRINTGEKPFQCKICLKEFGQKGDLTKHMGGHMGEEKPHRCQFCMKRFVTQYELKRHTRVHTGEKPYGCDICTKQFRTRHQLYQHTCRNEEPVDLPHECEICLKRYKDFSSFNSHKCVRARSEQYKREMIMKNTLNHASEIHTDEYILGM